MILIALATPINREMNRSYSDVLIVGAGLGGLTFFWRSGCYGSNRIYCWKTNSAGLMPTAAPERGRQAAVAVANTVSQKCEHLTRTSFKGCRSATRIAIAPRMAISIARNPFPRWQPGTYESPSARLAFSYPTCSVLFIERLEMVASVQPIGIVGTKGGFKLDQCSLESCYQEMLELEQDNSVWRWPQRLLPLANYGCGMWSCVDCEYKTLLMILWDPNNVNAELDGADARLNWGHAFWDQSPDLSFVRKHTGNSVQSHCQIMGCPLFLSDRF